MSARRLLVVEDNAADFRLLERRLRGIPGTRYALTHLPGAEPVAEVEASDFDCIVLDHQLGASSGLDVLKALRARGVDTPVIALTGTGSEEIAVRVMKEGAQDYLVKGCSPLDLHRAIQRAIDTVTLQRQLARQQEELSAFVALAAHDLRAPLRHVEQFVGLLGDELTEPQRDEYMEPIKSAVGRMTGLLDALMTYATSGREAAPLESVDLNTLAREVAADLSAVLDDAGATLEIGDLPIVPGDAVALRQMLQNLIGNAIKYNDRDAPHVSVRAAAEEGGVALVIEDDGIGIDPKDHERIFEPLRRLHAHDRFEGSGVGLAIVAKIVKQHNGDIHVRSALGEGSAFTVRLPT